MAKTRTERNREAREKRIAKYGLDWERERSAKSYTPVNQLSPTELKKRRKQVKSRVKKYRTKNPQPSQVKMISNKASVDKKCIRRICILDDSYLTYLE